MLHTVWNTPECSHIIQNVSKLFNTSIEPIPWHNLDRAWIQILTSMFYLSRVSFNTLSHITLIFNRVDRNSCKLHSIRYKSKEIVAWVREPSAQQIDQPRFLLSHRERDDPANDLRLSEMITEVLIGHEEKLKQYEIAFNRCNRDRLVEGSGHKERELNSPNKDTVEFVHCCSEWYSAS